MCELNICREMIYILLLILTGCSPKISISHSDIKYPHQNHYKRTTTSINLKEFEKEYSIENSKELSIAFNNYPVHPDCDNETPKKCFVQLLNNKIQKKFTDELANKLDLNEGKTRIYIYFELDETGSIKNIDTRSPHEKLDEIGVSIIETIPRMKPYLKNNKPSNLKFYLSILYLIE